MGALTWPATRLKRRSQHPCRWGLPSGWLRQRLPQCGLPRKARASEANKLWIWTALDRTSGRLIDWECGDRDQATFERLLTRLRRWKVRLVCTDEYVVYQQSLSAGQHYAGKDQTVALERTHSRLRHWLARFRRRICVVSRSKDMVDRSIALVAHLQINQG